MFADVICYTGSWWSVYISGENTMKYRIELIEQFRNGALINAVKEEIPQNNMASGYGRFVTMADGHDDHFRITAVFPDGCLYYNHFHIFHTANAILVYLKPGWDIGVSGRLWVKYAGVDEFILLGEINNDYEPGIIIGPQFDDYMRNQWFETKPDGKMVKYYVNREGVPEVIKSDDRPANW